MIHFEINNNKKITLSTKAAILSNLIRNTIEDDPNEDEDDIIKLPFSHGIISTVFEFMETYAVIPYDNKFINDRLVDQDHEYEYYTNFLNLSFKDLYKLAEVADFLDVPPLFNLLLTKMSNLTKNKTIEQLSEIMEIPMKSISTKSEEQLEIDYKWVAALVK